MCNIIKFEFLKILTNKIFLYAFILFFIANIVILGYTENLAQKNEIPYSAYQLLNHQLQNLTPEEKEKLIENEYERITALNLIQMVQNLKNSNEQEMKEYANTLKNEKLDLYEKYKSEFENKPIYAYTGDIGKELSFWEEIKTEYDEVYHYDNLIENILEKADNLNTISIFRENQDQFSIQNMKDTANQYEKMKNTLIDYQVAKGINCFTKLSVTDLFIILLSFVIAFVTIFEEREKNLFTIIKSTKNGRTKTIVAKMIVTLISIAAMSLLFYCLNLIYYGIQIGYGDLGASIQSISTFLYSTLKINIGTYLLLFVGSKIMVYIIIAFMIILVATLAKNSVTTYLTWMGIFIISYFLYTTIEPTSSWNLLKYLNLFHLIEVNSIYTTYFNLKLGSGMQNLLNSSMILMGTLLIGLIVTNVIVFYKKRDLQVRKQNGFYRKKANTLAKFRIFASVFGCECYKLWITNKVAILLTLLVLFQIYHFQNTQITISFNENVYQNYMKMLEGKLTEDKVEFIEGEKQKYEQAENKIEEIKQKWLAGEIDKIQAKQYQEPYEEILSGKEIFARVLEKYEYIKENSEAEFVYDTGYQELLGLKPNHFIESDILLIAMTMICFTSIFVMEYRTGAIRILNTTPKGRKETAKSKIMACVVVGIIIYIASSLPEILKIGQVYGYPGISASITSLSYFSNLPTNLSIAGYAVILYMMRLVAYIGILLFVLWISLKLKNTTYTILVAGAILLIPLILILAGIDILKPVSISAIFNMSQIISSNNLLKIIYLTIPFLIGGFSYHRIKKTFE